MFADFESVKRNEPTFLRRFSEKGLPARAGTMFFGLTEESLAESDSIGRSGSIVAGSTFHVTVPAGLTLPAASVCVTEKL